MEEITKKYKVLDVREYFIPYKSHRGDLLTSHKFIFILENINGVRKRVNVDLEDLEMPSDHYVIVTGDEVEFQTIRENKYTFPRYRINRVGN